MHEYNARARNARGALIDIRKALSFRHFETADGTVVGMFQGDRGARRHLDFQVKVLLPGKKARVRTPAHMHWAVSFLIMADRKPRLARKFIERCRDFFHTAKPFRSRKQRLIYRPVLPKEARKRFHGLDTKNIYSVETIALLIELFTICEKATPLPGNKKKMFQKLIEGLADYCVGKRDFFQVIGLAAPGWR